MENRSDINKNFIPYKLALKLKELGFKEECLASYYHAGRKLDIYEYINHSEYTILAPLWQQVFDWFMEKYNLFVKFDFFQSDEFKSVDYDYCIIDLNKPFKEDGITDNPLVDYSVNETYYFKLEEARLECLKKLIELCGNKP